MDEAQKPASATTKRPRTTIRNPYGKKTVTLPPISNKPLYGSSVGNDSGENAEGTNSESNQMSPAALKTPPPPPIQATSTDASLPSNSAHASIPAPSSYQGPMSVSLPPWQRLPSQNLSFGSAEILSVSECVQHAPLYHQFGRSIRCTGIVEQVMEGCYPNQVESNNLPLPYLSVRLSDPLVSLDRHDDDAINLDARPAAGPHLWAVFMTCDQTAAIRATPLGAPVTVMGEPMALCRDGWGLRVRLCFAVDQPSNLALEREALLLRRSHLLSRVEQGDLTGLPAGCGPPPYT